MPSLNATPVTAAKRGPTSHTAPGWVATYSGSGCACTRGWRVRAKAAGSAVESRSRRHLACRSALPPAALCAKGAQHEKM